MTPDKFIKYRKGNFELKSKHIYAKQKLENIRDYILLSHNLVGGDVPNEITKLINGKNNYNKDDDTKKKVDYLIKLQNKIEEEMTKDKNVKLLVKSTDEQFKNIMEADKDIVKVFDHFINTSNLSDKNDVNKLLFQIQKSLFNLQAKIIFSSLKKVDNIDVKPLLQVIEQKINAMNDYIDKQENEFNSTTSNPITLKPITYISNSYNIQNSNNKKNGGDEGMDNGKNEGKDDGENEGKDDGGGKGKNDGRDEGGGKEEDDGGDVGDVVNDTDGNDGKQEKLTYTLSDSGVPITNNAFDNILKTINNDIMKSINIKLNTEKIVENMMRNPDVKTYNISNNILENTLNEYPGLLELFKIIYNYQYKYNDLSDQYIIETIGTIESLLDVKSTKL